MSQLNRLFTSPQDRGIEVEQHQVADAYHQSETEKFWNCLLHKSALYALNYAHDGYPDHANQRGENGGIKRQRDDVFDEFEHMNLSFSFLKVV